MTHAGTPSVSGKHLDIPEAVCAGYAETGKVGEECAEKYRAWIARGDCAGMEYLRRNMEVRSDPRLLLDGARTLVSAAFGYAIEGYGATDHWIAEYALGPDYHERIKGFLRKACIEGGLGEEGRDWRVFADSAPLMERYWAERCGVGKCGGNGMLCVAGYGPKVFLGEIVTVHALSSVTPRPARDCDTGLCTGCGACRNRCPSGALGPDGNVDARRCLSYLTIEHRGDWDREQLQVMQGDAGRGVLFGCDRCVNACGNGKNATAGRKAGAREREMAAITPADILGMDAARFATVFRGTAVKRAKHDGLLRNAGNACAASGTPD